MRHLPHALLIAALSLSIPPARAEDRVTVDTKGAHVFLGDKVQMNFGLLYQLDRRQYTGDTVTSNGNEFKTRRLRPIFEMMVGKNFTYNIVLDYAGPVTRFQDHYVDYKFDDALRLRAGKFKMPLGLEYLQSEPNVPFIERGYVSSFAPARDVGVQASGKLLEGALEYQAAIMQGNADGAVFDSNGDSHYDYALRLIGNPFKGMDVAAALKPISIGMAGSIGQHDGNTSRPLLASYRSLGQQTIFRYSSGTIADGTGWRFIPQAEWYYKNMSLRAEYGLSSQEVRKGAATEDLTHRAWQINGSYVLTGEDASSKSVMPKDDFDPFNNQWGALELVARVGGQSFDDDSFGTFASATNSVKSVRSAGVGLMWHLTYNYRLSTNYEHSMFDGGAAGGRDRVDEDIIFSRLQIRF